MTQKQLHILQHAYGADQYGQGGGYRRHFCAGAGDEQACRELVALGFMHEIGPRPHLPYYNCSITEAGIAAMRAASPAPPKLTRAQKRYRRFLDWADAYGGTMREFFEYEKNGGRANG